MSNLWVQAMSWTEDTHRGKDMTHYTPVHVRQAGFAGYVGDSEDDAERREDTGQSGGGGNSGHSDFDEDLYDESSPEPTSGERRHHQEHDEMPESYYERHDQAYEQAKARRDQARAAENTPDIEDPELRHFIGEHGSNTKLWHDKGRTGKINLRQPVYATQTHVAKEHIAKYLAKPNATSHHRTMYGPGAGGDYLGEEHPMFVTHQGRLHVTEGHHRVAAELQRGSKEMYGHHFNLDEHPQYGNGEINDGDEDD